MVEPTGYNQPLSEEVARITVEEVARQITAGGLYPFKRGQLGRSAVADAAAVLGIQGKSVKRRLEQAWKLYQLAPHGIEPEIEEKVPEPKEMTPAEERAAKKDVGFWKKRFIAAEKELAENEHTIKQLAGLWDHEPNAAPDWDFSQATGPKGRSVVGCLLSDVHMGEVIQPDEILGTNRFDPDVCEDRLMRYFQAACTIGQRWAADTTCEGALLCLGGDMVSGSIHHELDMTNALTSPEQVLHVVSLVAAGIRALKDTYGKVLVVSVPGNHGRTTMKPTAKLYSRLSYDIMIAEMLRQRFADDPAIAFQHGVSKDQIIPIFGRTVFLTHGDKIGTKGGMGFAGPMLPIVRGTKKIEAQQARFGRRPDLILHGHYHTTGNPGNVLSNGSVPGYGEYADDLRAEPEDPQQWLFLLHSKWGLRERAAIKLEPPRLPDPIRVRVPAGWREA